MASTSEHHRPDRRDFLTSCAGVAAALFTVPALAQPRPAPIGLIEEIRGEAFAELAGVRRALAAKGEIHVGDLLSTGDNALLVMKLGPATTIKLGAQARLKIDRYLADAGGEFDMQAGPMMFERKGKPASEGITFRSAFGLIAIRGTRFYAGPNRGAFAVLVGEGRVEVRGGTRTVSVEPQYGIDIKVPGQAPTTPARWGLPRIREMQANFR